MLVSKSLGPQAEPALPENYESAASRHFEDATGLREAGRTDNAGHLIGFAAECAIKCRITALQPGANSPQGHFPDLLVSARKQLGPRSRYTGMYDILKGDIFRGWRVNRRYDETGQTTAGELESWFTVTKRLFATAGIKVHK